MLSCCVSALNMERTTRYRCACWAESKPFMLHDFCHSGFYNRSKSLLVGFAQYALIHSFISSRYKLSSHNATGCCLGPFDSLNLFVRHCVNVGVPFISHPVVPRPCHWVSCCVTEPPVRWMAAENDQVAFHGGLHSACQVWEVTEEYVRRDDACASTTTTPSTSPDLCCGERLIFSLVTVWPWTYVRKLCSSFVIFLSPQSLWKLYETNGSWVCLWCLLDYY